MRATIYTYTALPNDLRRDRQKFECAEEADTTGCEVTAWFHGEAGDRSGLDSLGSRLHGQRFNAIFVRDQSRFGRSFNAIQKVINAVEAAGVRLIYCDEPSSPRFVTTLFSEVTAYRASITSSR